MIGGHLPGWSEGVLLRYHPSLRWILRDSPRATHPSSRRRRPWAARRKFGVRAWRVRGGWA